MATSFKASVCNHAEGTETRYFPVTAGQTFVKGDLVYYTSDAVSICGTDPSSIAGIALADAADGLATGGSIWGGTKIPVQVLTSQAVVFMAADGTAAQTAVGDLLDIENSSAGVWRVQLAGTGAQRVFVQDFSASPQQEGLFVKFVAEFLQFDAIAT